MPSRVVREGINSSERINSLSEFAELGYRRLLHHADDHGRYWADVELLRLNLFPMKECRNVLSGKIRSRPTQKRMELVFKEWLAAKLITLYGNGRYLIVNKSRQQFRGKSKFPEPTDLAADKRGVSECYAHPKVARLTLGEGEGGAESVVERVAPSSILEEKKGERPLAARDPVAVVHALAADVAKGKRVEYGGSPLQVLRAKLNGIYKRPETQAWSYAEESLLAEISRRPEALAEMDLIWQFRRRLPLDDKKFFPQRLGRLLEDWNGTLDRARLNAPPKSQPLTGHSQGRPKGPLLTEEARARMAAELKEMREGKKPLHKMV